MNFAEFREWFDGRFSQLLEQKSHEFASLSQSGEVQSMVSYLSVIAQKGKRFRPFLVYQASGADTPDQCEKLFAVLASVELLHIFALIHDDIMDEADTRHDAVCAHKKFAPQYGEATAEAVGILLGDIVFAWAYECLFEYAATVPNVRDRVKEEFMRLVREVTHGQMLDILSPTQQPLSMEALIEKMTLKTARYSFVQPLRLGFVVRGDRAEDHAFAEDFGVSLGIGFQLQDDLLDSAQGSGKTQFVDIQSKQQTLLSWYMHNKASGDAQKDFFALFGKRDMSDRDREQLSVILESSGALAYVHAQSAQYFAQAADAIRTHRADDQMIWQEILGLVQERKK